MGTPHTVEKGKGGKKKKKEMTPELAEGKVARKAIRLGEKKVQSIGREKGVSIQKKKGKTTGRGIRCYRCPRGGGEGSL